MAAELLDCTRQALSACKGPAGDLFAVAMFRICLKSMNKLFDSSSACQKRKKAKGYAAKKRLLPTEIVFMGEQYNCRRFG
jgi:hypothetical protein